ncbi:YceH family protein [soil metagenome]
MDNPLDVIDIRVLGSLIEKEITTPDNYPLTLNALTTACNQTSNRDPVLEVAEAAVLKSLEELGRRSLVRAVHRSDSRAKRYRHLLAESMNLHAAEIAVMCVLMLRGAQTAGEIRTRTARLFEFPDPAHLDITLQALMTLASPLVTQLPRQPGQKEVRYAHLLAGEPRMELNVGTPSHDDASSDAAPEAPDEASRINALEHEVASLRADVAEVRKLLEEFRRQFE